MEEMMVIANQLGFEEKELNAISVDLYGSKCNAGICSISYLDIKEMDKMVNGAPLLKKVVNKIQCHPVIKDEVMPKVQYIWRFFPFNWFCSECFCWFELFLNCCNPLAPVFWVIGTIVWFFSVPWNLFCGNINLLLCPIAWPIYPLLYVFWTIYYIVVPP